VTKGTFLKIWDKFIVPFMHACPTCEYTLHTGIATQGEDDECVHPDYVGASVECLEGWWEDNMCKKWELVEWLRPVVDEISPLSYEERKCLQKEAFAMLKEADD